MIAEFGDRVLKGAVDRFDAVPEQILKPDDERETRGRASRASLTTSRMSIAAAVFLKRLAPRHCLRVDREITAAPAIDVVSGDGGTQRPTRSSFFRAQRRVAERIINHRGKHASPLRENSTQILFDPTSISDELTNRSITAVLHLRSLVFRPAGYVRADEQNGDRGAGARGLADQRRLRGFSREQRQGLHHLCRSNGRQRDHDVHARISKERPLTHDLMAHLMTALGAKVERVIINDLKNATYYARMIIRAENELQQKKIIELDGRPSDCIAMATQQKAPIYVSQEVWDEVDDMSDVLRKMEEEGLKPDIESRNRNRSRLEE